MQQEPTSVKIYPNTKKNAENAARELAACLTMPPLETGYPLRQITIKGLTSRPINAPPSNVLSVDINYHRKPGTTISSCGITTFSESVMGAVQRVADLLPEGFVVNDCSTMPDYDNPGGIRVWVQCVAPARDGGAEGNDA